MVPLMHRPDPAHRIGEARGIEFVRSPFRSPPVKPVLHDIIDGDAALPIAGEHVEALSLRLITLAALPEAERPPRHHRRLSGEAAVASNDSIEVWPVDEVVIDAAGHLGPERRGRVGRGRFPQEPHRSLRLIGGPFESQRIAPPRLEAQAGQVIPGKPALAPVVDHEPAVDPELDIAGGKRPENMVTAHDGLHRALPAHAHAPGRRERRINSRVGLRRFGGYREVDARIVLRRDEPFKPGAGIVRRGQAAAPAVRIDQLRRGNRLRILQTAEAGARGIIPQDSITAARDQEGHRHLCVALPEIEVVALDVHEAELVLAETVQRLIRIRLPLLAHLPRLLPLYCGGRQHPPARFLGKDALTRCVEERHDAGRQFDPHFEFRGVEHRRVVRSRQGPRRHRAVPRHHGHARTGEERPVLRIGHADNVVRPDFDLESGVAERDDDSVSHLFGGAGIQPRRDAGENHHCGKHRQAFSIGEHGRKVHDPRI